MSYPEEDPYYNESVGYPKFSEVHDYPNPVNQNYPFPEEYKKKKKKKKTQQYYEEVPKPTIPKQKKYKIKKVPKQPAQPKAYIPLTGPQNQLYMSQGGHKYIAKPVGPPKLVPVAVQKPQYQPTYVATPPPPQPMPIPVQPYAYYPPTPVAVPTYGYPGYYGYNYAY